MKKLQLSSVQLSTLLNLPNYRVLYLAKMLGFLQIAEHPITFEFDESHPFYKSLQLCRLNPNAKPLYSIKDLSNLWTWHDKPYSKSAIRKRLNNLDIPIYNKEKKGYVYLYDLQRIRSQQENTHSNL